MAFRIGAINGMGEITEPSPGDFDTVGMIDAGVMNAASQVIANPGVRDIEDGALLVTETSPASADVSVAAGTCYVLNDAYTPGGDEVRYWEFNSNDAEDVTIVSNSSGNPRIDLICAAVDPLQTPGNDGAANCSIEVVQGTPASTPAAPAVPVKHTVLAQVAVASGFTSITDTDITDMRSPAQVVPSPGFDGQLNNGRISATVTSNNLTVQILTLNGQTPSEQNPVFATINNELVKITSALSITLNAGTSYFASGSANFATFAVDYFVYLLSNSGGIKLAFARIPNGKTYADFSGTNTNERYLAYSGSAPSSSDPVQVIGRFTATLSASAGHQWSSPTGIINKPIYESELRIYAPTLSGYSAAPASAVYRYKIDYDTVSVLVRENNGGTSNNATTTYSAPFTSSSPDAAMIWVGPGAVDEGTASTTPGALRIPAASATITVTKAWDFVSNWATSGNKRIRAGNLTYQIA